MFIVQYVIQAVIDLAKSKPISPTWLARYKYLPISSQNQSETDFDFAKSITALLTRVLLPLLQ
jgi:hypothetical protein